MAKDDVGDDLRFRRIFFDLATRTEPIVRAHPREQLVKPGRPKARPLAAAEQGVPGNDQDILARAHGLSLAMHDAAVASCARARDGRCRRSAAAWAWGSRAASDPAWPARR